MLEHSPVNTPITTLTNPATNNVVSDATKTFSKMFMLNMFIG